MDIVNLQIQKYTGMHLVEAAKLISKHRLYESSDWDLLPTSKRMAEVCDPLDIIMIATLNDQVIGCSLFTHNYYYGNRWSMCYVKAKYRMKGIGQQLITSLGINNNFNYGAGVDGSMDFWSKIQDRLQIKNDHITQHITTSGTILLIREELK